MHLFCAADCLQSCLRAWRRARIKSTACLESQQQQSLIRKHYLNRKLGFFSSLHVPAPPAERSRLHRRRTSAYHPLQSDATQEWFPCRKSAPHKRATANVANMACTLSDTRKERAMTPFYNACRLGPQASRIHCQANVFAKRRHFSLTFMRFQLCYRPVVQVHSNPCHAPTQYCVGKSQ